MNNFCFYVLFFQYLSHKLLCCFQQPTACGTCSNVFQSRNKLFEHLRQTGHAVYKNENAASGKKQKKKKL